MKKPPIWLFALLAIVIYTSLSIGIVYLFNLPAQLPISKAWSLAIGIAFLAIGFPIMISGLWTLTIRRAIGGEIHSSKDESKLITSGIFSHTRNPLYFSAIMLFIGWFFVFRATFILFLTLFFLIHFCAVARWEERELTKRFGEEYIQYKKRVPFFFPSFGKRSTPKN